MTGRTWQVGYASTSRHQQSNRHSPVAACATAAHPAVSSLGACTTPDLRAYAKHAAVAARSGVLQPLTIAVSRECWDRPFTAMARVAKADLQIASSFHLTWPAPVQRERVFAAGNFLGANSRCAQKSIDASSATKKQASTFQPKIQLLFLYPDSRWLRIASTKAVLSGATYLYNAT